MQLLFSKALSCIFLLKNWLHLPFHLSWSNSFPQSSWPTFPWNCLLLFVKETLFCTPALAIIHFPLLLWFLIFCDMFCQPTNLSWADYFTKPCDKQFWLKIKLIRDVYSLVITTLCQIILILETMDQMCVLPCHHLTYFFSIITYLSGEHRAL